MGSKTGGYPVITERTERIGTEMKLTDFIRDIGRPVAFYPGLRKITGSTVATLFLCQFIYWTGKQNDPDGWIYKTSDDIETETGLSYDEQVTARKHLIRRNLIEEKYIRLDHIMKFRIVPDAIDSAWNSRNRESGFRENGDSGFGNEGIQGSLKNHRIQSDTTIIDKTAAIKSAGPVSVLGYDPADIDDITETFEPSESMKELDAVLAEAQVAAENAKIRSVDLSKLTDEERANAIADVAETQAIVYKYMTGSTQAADAYKERIAATLTRSLANHANARFDLSAYPEDIRPVLTIFCERWKIDPPGGKKPSSDWLKSGRELLSATAEFGADLLSLFADRYFEIADRDGYPPFTVARPGSLKGPVISFAAELRRKGSTESGPAKGRGRTPIEFGRGA